MTATTHDTTTAQAVAVLAAAYPRQAFPPDSIRLYVRMLADLDSGDIADAVTRLVKRSTFLPSIAEIRREVAEARLGLPSPAVAWEMALDPRGWATMPEPVRAAYDACGGGWAFRTTDRPTTLRSQFERDYADRREAALVAAMGAAPERRLPPPTDWSPAVDVTRVDGLPATTSLAPRPVWRRHLLRANGHELDAPTDIEKADAIRVLRSTDDEVDLAGRVAETLREEAQRILDEASP